MKITVSINSPFYGPRTYTHELDLPGYYRFDDVRKDLDQVLELHQFRLEKYRIEYIEQYGEESWNKMHGKND